MAAAAEEPADRLRRTLYRSGPMSAISTPLIAVIDGRAALVLVADHAANQRFDVERIAPQHASLDPLMGERLDGFLLPFESCFSHARQAGVGVQANEQIVPQPGVGHQGSEARQGSSRAHSRGPSSMAADRDRDFP